MRKSLIGLLFVLYLSMSFLSNLKVEAGNDWCEIGVSYQAVDGLTVTLHSFQIIEKTGSYQYTITYTLENNTPDKKILEGAFKLYYRDTSGGLPQYGFFDYLYPGDSITRTYTFEELKDALFDVLEYHHDNFFSDEPLEDSLKWKVVYPDSIPPITQHDYDGAWKNSDFTITLTATDNINRIEEIYYRINEGPIKRVSVDGYPLITNESANNTLEYWSVDWAGNEELPHKILTGIKLDKTLPSISDHSRFPKDNVEPNEPVKVVVNVTDSLSGINSCLLLYRVLEARKEITIDGKLDDWKAFGLTPLGTDIEGNIRVYNPWATDLLEAWGYYSSENLYLALKVSLDYDFEYYEGWVRYYVLFDVSYENESDDLGYGMGEYLLVWSGTANIGLFEFWNGEYVRIANLMWDEHAEYHNTTDYTGCIELKIPMSYFWKGEEITNMTIRFETYDVEHKETVNTIGDYEIITEEHVWTVIPMTLNQTTMLYEAFIQIQQPNV